MVFARFIGDFLTKSINEKRADINMDKNERYLIIIQSTSQNVNIRSAI